MVWFISHMLAAYMDFCVGVLIATLLWLYGFKERPALWLVCLGGVLALVPDFDIVWPILTRGSFVDHHQLPTHFPLVMVPLAAVVAGVLGGGRFAVLAVLCLAWHFVHDSPPLGGGIAWAAPFNFDYWSWSGQRVPPIYPTHEAFMRGWAAPSPLALSELVMGSVALGVAATLLNSKELTLRYPALYAFTVIGVWVSAWSIWAPQAIIALR